MKRAMKIEDLFQIERLAEICISPDGQTAWLGTRKIDLEQNKTKKHNYVLHLAGNRQPVTVDLHDKGASDFVYSGDGKRLFFVAGGQIYCANADGSNARQITHKAAGASKPVPDFTGKRILFARSVYMDEACRTAADKGEDLTLAQTYGLAHPKAKARTANSLLYRHWDSWTENKRNHLFMADTETGECIDLTPEDADTPPIALDSGLDYAFSPDGKHIAFVKNPDTFTARSTNNSIYLMPVDGMKPGIAHRISDTDGCDTAPRFISDTQLAYCTMLTPGYEADAVRLKVFDLQTHQTRLYLEDFERSVSNFMSVGQNKILFSAQDFAHVALYELDFNSGKVMQLTSGRTYNKFAASADGSRILVGVESLANPAECAEISGITPFEPHINFGQEDVSSEKIQYLTHFGDVLSDVERHNGQCIHYDYQGRTLEGYVVTPPGYDETKKYPLILLIHGGPQGAFLDSFHYRWNVQMFASRGAVVAFCNPHGSTGYGHDLTRSISRHWGDECPEAILTFVDHVLAQMPQVDAERLTAAGASFGGFMINWLMGHTDRFKAFVSHDGIFNTEMAGYITDELWFSEYEFGGKPFDCPEEYLKHSPHRFVKNFKTPTLVVQGEQDFRCFISEGVALFTALQYMGVESRLLYFPGEGHWVLDPANSSVWYEEVLSWLMGHV